MAEDTFALRDEMHRFEEELSFAIDKISRPGNQFVNQNQNANVIKAPNAIVSNLRPTRPLFTQFIPNQLVKKAVISGTSHLQPLQPPPGFRPPNMANAQFQSLSRPPSLQHHMMFAAPHMGMMQPPPRPIMLQTMSHNNMNSMNDSNRNYSNNIPPPSYHINSQPNHLTQIQANTNETKSENIASKQSKIIVAAPSIKYEKPSPISNTTANILPALQRVFNTEAYKMHLPQGGNTFLAQPPPMPTLTPLSSNKIAIPTGGGDKSLASTSGDKVSGGKDKDKNKKKKKKKKREQEDLSIPTSKPIPKKSKIIIRHAAGSSWIDGSLLDWDPNDYRIFCGDLGNEVSDEVLTRAFNRYPSFQRAKVVRDKRNNKTKGFGFVSFKDALDYAKAMKEMNGKYVGSRPIKLRKSAWQERSLDMVRKRNKEKQKLVNQIKAL